MRTDSLETERIFHLTVLSSYFVENKKLLNPFLTLDHSLIRSTTFELKSPR